MIAAIHITLAQVASTLALVAIAVAVSVWQHDLLERDIGVAVIRSFVQLTAIGYMIDLIFDQDNLAFVGALLATMVLFGALTARSRAQGPRGLLGAADRPRPGRRDNAWPPPRTRRVRAQGPLPGAGRRHGDRRRMTAAAVALSRLGDDVADYSASQIEATLALGATSTQAIRLVLRRNLRSGMIPLIDSTKTTGLIFFPARWSACCSRAPRRWTQSASNSSCSTCCSAASPWER